MFGFELCFCGLTVSVFVSRCGMNLQYGSNGSFRGSMQVNGRILGNIQILYLQCLADLHVTDINFNLVNQICGQCLVGNFLKHLLYHAGLYVVLTKQDYLSYGMNLFIAYQCLEINLINSACQWVKINLFNQCIVCLTIYLKHNLTSFVVSL